MAKNLLSHSTTTVSWLVHRYAQVRDRRDSSVQQVRILHRSPAVFRGRSFQALVLCLGQAPAVVSPQLSGPTGIPTQYVNCLSLALHETRSSGDLGQRSANILLRSEMLCRAGG